MPFPMRRRKSAAPEWVVGSRVVVRRDPDYGPGPWPAEPAGRIAPYPDGATYVQLPTRKGRERAWWIIFDEPQYDPDGDGPYRESQVLERYLSPPP
jgi:hypothetical protein